MQTRRGILGGVLIAAICISGAAFADSEKPFRVESPFIRDDHGRVVFFHGVNAVWKVSPYYPPSASYSAGAVALADSYFDDRDAQFLADNGLNSVRLGIIWKGLEPKQDSFDETPYLDRIENIVDFLGQHGVTVMLDFHQDMANERFQGEGWPDWATHTEVVPNQELPAATLPTGDFSHVPDAMAQFGFPVNYFTPPVQRAFDNLWLNNFGLWGEYRKAWKKVAKRFKDKQNVIGYDLLNEPWPASPWESCAQTQGCPAFDIGLLQPFYEEVIKGIRSVDSESIVWWEPHVVDNDGAANNVGLVRPIYDPGDNQGIAFHTYCLLGGQFVPGLSRTADPECPIGEEYTFRQQRQAAERNGSSLFLTEFGASEETVDIGRVADFADRYMVSWHYWAYGAWFDPTGNPAEEGLFPSDTGRFDSTGKPNLKPKVDALIRTYPQAVAGIPQSFSFDPVTKKFTLTFTADGSIAAPTEIFVPVARHYPNGYAVTVIGDVKVLSGPPSDQLLVVQNIGSGSATVTVTPK